MTKGERIKLLREQKGLTQTELAVIAKTTKQNIYKYETGLVTNIPSDKLVLIAEALDSSPAYIMGWENQSNMPSSDKYAEYSDNEVIHVYEDEADLRKIFSANIKRLAEKNGVQQNEIAKICDVTPAAVNNWFLGIKMPRMGAIQKIADFFQVPKSELIERKVVQIKDNTPDVSVTNTHSNVIKIENINSLKKIKGMTNEQISKISGISLSTIDKITAGITPDPKISTVKAIVNAMGYTLNDLDDINVSLASQQDAALLERFHKLDDYGKKAVESVLQIEYERCCGATVKVFKAAHSTNDEPPAIIEVPKSLIDKLENAPNSDDDL